MSKITSLRFLSLLFSTSFLITLSCIPKKSAVSTPSSEVTYDSFSVNMHSFLNNVLPSGIDDETDYDAVFKFGVRNDISANWQFWNPNSTIAKVGWELWCDDDPNVEISNYVITSGVFEFSRNLTNFPIIENRDLVFSRAFIDQRCGGNSFYLTFGGPQYLSSDGVDYLPLTYFNFRDEIVRKGKYPEGIVRRIHAQSNSKILEIAKSHSALLKTSGSQRDIYCAIQSYTDILLSGNATELTRIFEAQFGSIEKQTIDCNTPLDIRKKINACEVDSSNDEVFCTIYAKYRQDSSWLATSLQLLREIKDENTLSIRAAKLRLDSIKELESKQLTFKT